MRTLTRAFLLTVMAAFLAVTPWAGAEDKAAEVRADVLAAVEGELARLSKQAQTEPGPVSPRPSSEVAFLLLAGLTGRGTEVKRPTAEELSQLSITPSSKIRVQVFAIAKDARIAVSAQPIQDRSGYWTRLQAVLYRRQGEKWIECGSGASAIDGVAQPD